MIRTAILAGILLVMLAIALDRPGTLPSFDRAPEPMVSVRPYVEPEQAQRAEAPRAQPTPVAQAEEPVRAPEPAAVTTSEESEVAEIAPQPAAILPAREVPPPVKTEPGRPISLLPEAQTAATQPRDPARYAPLVSDNMPAPPAPTLPPVQEAQLPPAPLPEINVPTRPVMVPRDYASRLMPENVAPENVAGAEAAIPPAAAAAAPAPQIADARTPTIAPGTKFMSPEERSRELYRLAREMEDTFIQKLTQ